MFNPILSWQQLLEQLVGREYLSQDGSAKIKEHLSQVIKKPKTPWYIRGLVGLGGWFAALFFIGFLAVAEIISDSVGAIVVGLIFCTLAVGVKRFRPASIFLGQLALAFSLAGQVMFIGGMADEINNFALVVVITLILEAALIAFYPDKLHRFLSTLIICGALFWLFIDEEIEEVSHLLVILLAVGTVIVWHYEAYWSCTRLHKLSRPVGYALPLALFGFLFLSFFDDLNIEWWWLSAAGVWLVLLYLAVQILEHLELQWQSKIGLWVLASTAILLIPAIQTPGILAALLVLLLGFQRGNRLLLGLAIAFLAAFLSGYYYNLGLTLLTKSGVLLMTGLILLGVRYGLQRGVSPLPRRDTLSGRGGGGEGAFPSNQANAQ